MRKLILGFATFIASLVLTACGGPPCLDANQPARVISVGTPNVSGGHDSGTPSTYYNSIKVRLADGSVRVCVVPQFVGSQLQVGDIVRGPISRGSDGWVQ